VEDVGMFYGRLVYFSSVWYISWHLDIFLVIWYISPRFGMSYQDKSGNPGGRGGGGLYVRKASVCELSFLIISRSIKN
jgi:hypothetical protein